MTPHEFYMFWKRPPQPIDVKTTNILATNSAEVHHISYLQTSVFKIHLVFIIYCCYIQFQFTLVTCSDLLSKSNAPFSENDPQNKSCKILKMIPEQKWPPPWQVIYDHYGSCQPLPPPLGFILHDISVFAGSMVLLFHVNHLCHRGISSLSLWFGQLVNILFLAIQGGWNSLLVLFPFYSFLRDA